MRVSRLGAICLGSMWFAACATAQEGGTPSASDGGSSGSISGGAPGTGGSNGAFGGSAAVPGGGGNTGHAGTGGLGSGTGGVAGLGSGGASGASPGGSAGAGGSGGSAPVFDPGVCATPATMSLSYKVENTDPRQIAAEYQFSNATDTPIPLTDLKIRYFFSSEETAPWSASISNAQIDGGVPNYVPITGASLTVVKLPTSLDGADSYLELGFPSGPPLVQGATASTKWIMQPDYAPPDQVQSNDYSYNAAHTTFAVWDHVVIYQGTTLVWGCVPKSLDSGGAGAGGDTGTGGSSATGAAGDTGAAGAP